MSAPDLICDAWTFDVGGEASSPEEFAEQILQCVLRSAQGGAQVVLLPEYTWLGLSRFVPRLPELADLIWNSLWPALAERLPSGLFVVAGTAPYRRKDGALFNRAVLPPGSAPQDKLTLTPWEREFETGDSLEIYEVGGARIAILICLDVEVPEHAARLRGREIDLILVPSATESVLGVERVQRCASARAVELGCAVMVSHLTGRGASELIDLNVGTTALFLPSQQCFAEANRQCLSPLRESGCHEQRFLLDLAALRSCRQPGPETSPGALPLNE